MPLQPDRPAPQAARPAATAIRDALATLVAGADALGCPLNDRQRQQFAEYIALIQRWGRVHNLTAVLDTAGITTLHLLDSLAAVRPLDRFADGRVLRLLDVGSGGGLPGVALAIARPAWQVTCLDAVAKKMGFVRQVVLELSLDHLQARHDRVERAPSADADVVVSRAFASLSQFVQLSRHHLAADRGVWLAMKGLRPDDEIAALPADIEVFHVEPLQVPGLDAERCLVWMRPVT